MNDKNSEVICDKVSRILSSYDDTILSIVNTVEEVDTVKTILKTKLVELLKSFNIDYNKLDVDDYFNIYVEIDNEKKINVIIKQKPIKRKIEGIWKII